MNLMTDTTEKIPTERLTIDLPEDLIGTPTAAEYAETLILTTAQNLHDAGKRPWMQVWYPWSDETNFDAVEVNLDTKEITTLPNFVLLTMDQKVVDLSDLLA